MATGAEGKKTAELSYAHDNVHRAICRHRLVWQCRTSAPLLASSGACRTLASLGVVNAQIRAGCCGMQKDRLPCGRSFTAVQ